ncbi:Microsomal glutathione S-transferase 3 [Rhynchospora pubera]|uniref:Glutathione S-transferase 3, mitochondrial n=1 Tax=Rhynchospora pubera TaxID=906938 RepID=A0AAV8CIL2_9POAL|nr:Microsomal glutathione S-transferase 3 [Rhynchospora pubera]
MAITIEFPKEYGYVVMVLVSYAFLNMWMSLQVGSARKKYRVPYPNLYASEERNKDANLFNCVQRGHQNSLEFMPLFFALLLVSGMQYPLIVSGLGTLYIIGRFFYFKGYSSGIPDKRIKAGLMSFLSLFGLMICTALFGVTLVIKETN